jgi:hypothetical protein
MMDLSLITTAAELLRNIEAAALAAGNAVAKAMVAGDRDELDIVLEVYPWIKDSGARSAGPAVATVRSVVPVATPTANMSSKFFRGTGKYVAEANGARVEIGTWLNPEGEIEAQRLTRVTGVQHYVDPRTGNVESIGGAAADAMAQGIPIVATEYVPPTGPIKEGMIPT